MIEKWTSAGLTTIPQLFAHSCAKWPDNIFLDFTGEKYSYAQTRDEVMRIAHGLRALGVGPGDRVASILDNVPDAIFLWFAANVIGAIYVPINTDYKGEYLRHQIVDSGAKIIITEGDYAERVFAVAHNARELEMLFYRGKLGDAETTLPTQSIDALRANDTGVIDSMVVPTDLALLIYTSGTTGPSKGCMVGHSYACNFGRQNHWHTRSAPGDVIWTPSPLFHANAAFGVVINALTAGATASIHPRFSVSGFWPEIERSGATHVAMLSIMLTLIPNAPESEVARRCFGQIRVLYGSPLGTELRKKWKEQFGVQHAAQPGYGMTEACMITLVSSFDDKAPGNSSGARHDDFDVRILDDNGDECPPNVPGEIVVRPRRPGVMFQGYWRRPEATAAATTDLWFHTGDIGKFDENDYFYFVDRKKDYLRRGGENISSFEVEATFKGHPALAEVAVHSVLSDLAEDELKVSAMLKEGAVLTEEELCRWSIDHLPHFAVPRYIEFRSSFPTTPTGKIQKHMLRSEGVTSTTWDRSASGVVIERKRRTVTTVS